MMDLCCVVAGLPVVLPLMGAIALWIKCVSPGPVLFRQQRIGFRAERFTLYKFRTMKEHADTSPHESHFRRIVLNDKPMVKLDLLCDPRLIPGGCLLRASGLDELPQWFNVLRGEMSLVGPRPCLVEEFRYFNKSQHRRFGVLPGLTGLWQVHDRGDTTFSGMNAMDAYYSHRSSPLMDLGIMLRTPFSLIRQVCVAIRHHRAARADDAAESVGSRMTFR